MKPYDESVGLPYSDDELARIRELQAARLRCKNVEHPLTYCDGRWLATLDALRRERDEAVRELAQLKGDYSRANYTIGDMMAQRDIATSRAERAEAALAAARGHLSKHAIGTNDIALAVASIDAAVAGAHGLPAACPTCGSDDPKVRGNDPSSMTSTPDDPAHVDCLDPFHAAPAKGESQSKGGDNVQHQSDCAVHNAPALPVGPCDCGAEARSEQAERVMPNARGEGAKGVEDAIEAYGMACAGIGTATPAIEKTAILDAHRAAVAEAWEEATKVVLTHECKRAKCDHLSEVAAALRARGA